ncbi:S9 family peptidase [Kordiimonas sp.]|uniref:S9 family peptidase n=1 Tax=Kordiimonas sp. TaxID=1970157 RepID=UPI003A93547D
MSIKAFCLGVAIAATAGHMAQADEAAPETFDYEDIFNLEYATGARITPDGKAVVYERRSMDIMSDSTRTNIWRVALDGSGHRPVLSGKASYRMPRFSPSGDRMAYVSAVEGKSQIYVRWTEGGDTARVTDLQYGPGSLAWSPDGKTIAFTMFVPTSAKPLFSLPKKPEGANWAGPAKVVDRVTYRADGAGYLPRGFTHVFTVPADGGTPRQITSGEFNHGGPISWTADGTGLILSANRNADWQLNPVNSEVYRVDVETGAYTALTDRDGPDGNPEISPDGKRIAYLGYADQKLSNQISVLSVMDVDGTGKKDLTPELDRSVSDFQWAPDGKGLYYSYDNDGKTHVAYVSLSGSGRILTDKLGGTTLGRPYSSGDFRVSKDGNLVFTLSRPDRPADLAVVNRIGKVTAITDLNSDVLGHKKMASVEEVRLNSSVDNRALQFWLVKPADFDASKQYPLILEIHGGPHTAYGPHFSSEIQMYAAKGYMVVYGNPRGSTSYGNDFANTIHHNYPSNDYDDLMDAVDTVIARGNVNTDELYVTGGSGGGVLTAWIIGKTDRFRAAVVAKPVINWISFVLTADFSPFFTKYWFPDMPWNAVEHYWKRSPLSLVGNVKTPTMLLTGEVDYRTPMSETEQYYQALKLQGVDSVMVRIPASGHGIASKPSNLVQKIGNIVAWFKGHAPEAGKDGEGAESDRDDN